MNLKLTLLLSLISINLFAQGPSRVYPLISGINTNPITYNSTTELYGNSRDMNEFRHKNLWKRIYNQSPIKLGYFTDVGFGESLGRFTIERSLTNFLSESYALNYGGVYFLNPSAGTVTAGGGQGVGDNDSWGTHYHCPNGGIMTGSSVQPADRLDVFWVAMPGFGTLLVETNSNSGTYGTLATLQGANASNVGMATNFTLPFLANYNVRLTSTGTNIVVGTSLWISQSPSFRQTFLGMGGTEVISNMVNMVPWTIWGPIMNGLNMDCIFVGSKDSAGSVATNIISLEALCATYCSNMDIVYIGQSDSLDSSGHQGMVDMRNAWLPVIQQFDRLFIDGAKHMGPTNYLTIPNDYSDVAHPQQIMDDFMSFDIAKIINLDPDSMLRNGFKFKWVVGNPMTADFNFSPDNTFNIGQTATFRPKDVNIAGTFNGLAANTVNDITTASGNLKATTGSYWGFQWYNPNSTTMNIALNNGSVIYPARFDNTGKATFWNNVTITNNASGEMWIHGYATELLTLSTGGTTTDTSANLLPANSVIRSVVGRVTTTITTATAFSVGDATIAARFQAVGTTLTLGSTFAGLAHVDQTGTSGPKQVAAAKVRVTTTGTPGAGAIRLTVFYDQFVAPSL